MTQDKAKLLRSLAIDRSAPAPAPQAVRGSRRGVLIGAVVVGCAVLGFAAFALTTMRAPKPVETVASQTAAPAPAQTPAQTQQQSAPPPPAAQTAQASPSSGLSASGYVVARRKATVAAEITGKVTEVFVDEGNTVTEGQVVAKLDSVLAEKDLELAKSRVDAADAAAGAIKADLQDAERILNRTQSLSKNNYATEADLTKAQARVGVLSAQLRQAEVQAQTARIDAKRTAAVLDQHSIKAPFSGVVVDRAAQPGEMISPLSAGGGFTRTGICTIVDMDSIEIEVDVNEAFIGRVSAGQAVNAVLDAYPDWTIPASVIAIVPTANRDKATVKVRIRFEQKDPRILPDMAVKVTFLTGQKTGAAGSGTATAAAK
jgi:RND family efflux transporter MFP subunit